MTTNIYILKLEGGRYYVGKTENPMKRYQEHLNGSGSAWTRKYKPVGIEKVIEKASPFDEDRYVKEYMAKYGMHKVRGGSYVTEYLNRAQEDSLNTEIRAATDACTSCGRQGHFARDCYAKTEVVHTSQPDPTKSNKKAAKEQDDYGFNKCYNCKMYGHIDYDCPNPKAQSNKTKPTQKKTVSDECYRCGRSGHYEKDCYARTDADGFELYSDEEEYNEETLRNYKK